MAMKSALPLLLLGGGALLLMGSKSKPTGTATTRKKRTPLPDIPKGDPEDVPEEEEEEPPVNAPINCPPGEVAVEVPPGSGNWTCIVSVKPIPMQTHELEPGEHTNLPIPARYNLNPPYLTPNTMITVDRMIAGQFELAGSGYRVLRNNAQTGQLLIELTEPDEWRISAHDGGFEGVFIAKWLLTTKNGL